MLAPDGAGIADPSTAGFVKPKPLVAVSTLFAPNDGAGFPKIDEEADAAVFLAAGSWSPPRCASLSSSALRFLLPSPTSLAAPNPLKPPNALLLVEAEKLKPLLFGAENPDASAGVREEFEKLGAASVFSLVSAAMGGGCEAGCAKENPREDCFFSSVLVVGSGRLPADGAPSFSAGLLSNVKPAGCGLVSEEKPDEGTASLRAAWGADGPEKENPDAAGSGLWSTG